MCRQESVGIALCKVDNSLSVWHSCALEKLMDLILITVWFCFDVLFGGLSSLRLFVVRAPPPSSYSHFLYLSGKQQRERDTSKWGSLNLALLCPV